MSDLYALALNATRELTPVELHGAVCGLTVCCPEGFPLESLLELVGVDAVTDEFSVESFVAVSIESLLAQDMSFAPLLPDDSLEIGVRVEGLSDWCAAFLAGLAAGLVHIEVNSLEELPSEAREIIGDIRAITDVDLSDPSNTELSADDDLMQLQEFVKVGVLLIMSLLNEDAEDAGVNPEDAGEDAEDGGVNPEDVGEDAEDGGEDAEDAGEDI
ncbi:MAG: UPF0149 family protein [Gammaproteobacteria bacterium]|nr:UPF0149 family protein [Gammaproteobacteria bacterium]